MTLKRLGGKAASRKDASRRGGVSKKITVALGAGVLVTLGLLPQARAELVYEPEVSPNAPAQVRAEDRANTRLALEASEKAQSTLQATQPVAQAAVAPVAVQVQPVQQYQAVAQPQPQYAAAPVQLQPQATAQVADDQQPVVESLSKTELMRRERTRTELQNEDLLQERLEELRLRDEKRRTAQLLGDNPDQNGNANAPVTPIPGFTNAAQAPQSEVVVSPVTAHPGAPAPEVAPIPTAAQAQQYSAAPIAAPAPVAYQASPYTPAAQAQMMGASSANAEALIPDEDKKSGFYLGAHAGVSGLNLGQNAYGLNSSSLGAFGVQGGVMVSDNMALEIGYTYASYGITIGQQYMAPGLQQYNYNLNTNVIDANLKLYVLGKDSRVRPFILGGGGYEIASLNYPSQYTAVYGSYINNNTYSGNSFLGDIGAGLDIQLSKTVSIGASFKYTDVFSTNSANNNIYFTNVYNQVTGATLQQASFYTVAAGVNFAI